ncbi:MAG: AMP-binding protein [Verrucomicrobia bacterium]|nr:AMP-binding protein [Verrucomicrobiota bacterium]
MTARGKTTRQAVEAAQFAKLRELLRALVPANAFYTRKLQAAGVTAEVGSLDEFRERVPFTTKQELAEDQLAHPPFGTNLTFPLERYTRLHQTSATTGTPLRWLDTPESWNWLLDGWVEVYRAAGVTADDRVFVAFSFGPFLGFWMGFEAAERLGCLCIPGGGLSSAARLRAIIENGAAVLCCTPSYALRLGEVAREEKLDLRASKVRLIIVAGEGGGSIPATRAAIAAAWNGARVFDHHGMTEVGPATFECPDRPCCLCVNESAYIAEVIKPATGKPVGEGQVGELVLTTLGRIGSPVLRYRTGDLVRPLLRDGRLLFEGGILGRADDVVIVRGVNLHPSAVENVIRAVPGVAEYRVEISQQHAMAEVKILVEPADDSADAAALARKVEHDLNAAFALRIPVSAVAKGTLQRAEMKAKRWMRI